MHRWGSLWMVLALVAGGSAWSQERTGVTTRYESEPAPKGAENRAEWFQWQRPDRVSGLLSVRPDEAIAVLGAGTSSFVLSLSSLVGESGSVYALEDRPELLDKLGRTRWPLDNVLVIRGEADSMIPGGALDLVLAVNEWHRIGDRRAMREKIRGWLKPGGRFVIIDWHDGEIPIAPPLERRLPHGRLVAEMKAAGWTLTTDSRMLRYQYFLIFTPSSG